MARPDRASAPRSPPKSALRGNLSRGASRRPPRVAPGCRLPQAPKGL